MEKPIIEGEREKDDSITLQELREYTSPRNQLIKLFSQKSTYISSSKKFEWRKQEVVFSLFYSFVISLIPAIIFSFLLLINEDFNSSGSKIGYRFLLVLITSTIVLFTLRIFIKRWLEIFSVFVFGILILYYLLMLAMVPYHWKICHKLNGSWQRDESEHGSTIPPILRIDYTCYIDREFEKNISQNGNFLNNMKYKIRN